MNYTMKAIPTTYNGINFRSRLEAKWAAMFDLLGWKWEYEPVDLDGWVPDFVLHGKVKVEIKPCLETKQFLSELERIEPYAVSERCVQTALFGASIGVPFQYAVGFNIVSFLYSQEKGAESAPYKFTYTATLLTKCSKCTYPALASFRKDLCFKKYENGGVTNPYWVPTFCPSCGHNDYFKEDLREIVSVEREWAEATNLTQYKNPNWAT